MSFLDLSLGLWLVNETTTMHAVASTSDIRRLSSYRGSAYLCNLPCHFGHILVEPPSELSAGINTLGIHVYVKPNRVSFDLYCGVHGGITIGWGFADTGGIDEVEKTCFDSEYPQISPDLLRFPIDKR